MTIIALLFVVSFGCVLLECSRLVGPRVVRSSTCVSESRSGTQRRKQTDTKYVTVLFVFLGDMLPTGTNNVGRVYVQVRQRVESCSEFCCRFLRSGGGNTERTTGKSANFEDSTIKFVYSSLTLLSRSPRVPHSDGMG